MCDPDDQPLKKLRQWIGQEVASGTSFAHGAILSTTSEQGQSRHWRPMR